MVVEKKIPIDFGGHELWLLPLGSAYWPEKRTLFVADLHLGKTTTFRKGGIPVPGGASQQTVSRLCRAIQSLDVEQLVILGDLVHSRCSWDDELNQCMMSLTKLRGDCRIMLVEGNHDRGSHRRWAEYSIQIAVPPFRFHEFVLLHDEETERPSHLSDTGLYLAGHRHPCVRIGGSSVNTARLKCFCIQNNCLTLPAFGEFTGAKNIRWSKSDRIYAIADDEILQISNS